MKRHLLIPTLALAVTSAMIANYGTGLQFANQPCIAHAKIQTNTTNSTPEQETSSMLPVQQLGFHLLEQNFDQTNPVLSPASAYMALCMTGIGAKGTTKKEIQKILGEDMLTIPKELMRTLQQTEDSTQLTIANSVWLDTKFTPKKKWLSTTENLFQADVFCRNLDTETAKDEINQWVSESTNHKIPKLLDKKLSKETRLALLNALYFHADWQQKFLAASTGKSEFKLDDGTSEQTDMMHAVIHNGSYFKDDSSEGVILPYADSHFAFVAIKPTGNDTIRDWYTSYSAKKLTALMNSSQTSGVELSLPKFTVRSKLNLNQSLRKIGMKQAFDPQKADLSLLGKSKDEANLYINRVLQEAVISVTEDGTEAAAATIVDVAAATSFIADMPVVNFDRSFLYFIMDMETGAPVFIGIIDNPKN